REQNELEIRGKRARRARLVVDQDAVGKEAAQRGLELVVVRVDEPRHDDLAAGVDLAGTACFEVRPDRDDLLALDQHVGAGELALVGHARVHRHHDSAADHIAPTPPAAVLRRTIVVTVVRARRRVEQAHPRGTGRGCRRSLQEIAPSELRARVVLRTSLVAQDAHSWSPPLWAKPRVVPTPRSILDSKPRSCKSDLRTPGRACGKQPTWAAPRGVGPTSNSSTFRRLAD